MNKAAQIRAQAVDAATRATALRDYTKKDYNALRIEDPELWENSFKAASCYDELAKVLNRRADIIEERERARASQPPAIHSGAL